MQHPFFSEYLDRLEALHAAVKEVVDSLDDSEEIDASASSVGSSIAELLAHIAGSETFWIGEMAGGIPSGRVRDEEFEFKGVPAADLLARLDAALNLSRRVLAALTLDDLTHTRVHPDSGRTYTVAWSLLHALEHVALHVGHLEITRDVLEENAYSGA